MDEVTAAAHEIRRATQDDLGAIRGILAAHGNDGPVTGADIVGPYVRHLLARHLVLVAEQDGVVIAFGALARAGIADHLADLFVVPARLGQGLGTALLRGLFAGAERRTTFASSDPRAVPSYIRAGMAPRWMSMYLDGDASRLPHPAGLEVHAADPWGLAALEATWTGAARAEDHAFWASQAEADPFLVTDAEGPVALAYARARQVSDVRALDRLVVRPEADPVPPILLALRRAARDGPVHCVVPGPNPVLPVLLEHGFRITDHDQHMASHADLVDAAHHLPNPGLL